MSGNVISKEAIVNAFKTNIENINSLSERIVFLEDKYDSLLEMYTTQNGILNTILENISPETITPLEKLRKLNSNELSNKDLKRLINAEVSKIKRLKNVKHPNTKSILDSENYLLSLKQERENRKEHNRS